MSFALYIVGLVLLIGGVAWALTAAHVAATYVAIACLILAGIGVMMAVSRTRSTAATSRPRTSSTAVSAWASAVR